jgi:hypothetical protein
LTIADKVKLKNNESSGSTNFQVIPFNGTDDVVDIHANTLAILNDLTAYTQRNVEAIEIDDDIDCVPFKDNFDNGLAGWVCTFDMLVHNNKDMCLFPLLEQPIYPPSPTTTTTTSGPTTTTTTIAPTTTTTSTTTTTTLAPITFEASGSCNGFEGNGVIDVYNVLGGGSFPKFVGLNDGIFYPLTTPTQSFSGLGNGTFEVTVKNNEGFETSQSVVLSCTPLPTTTTTTLAPTTTTTSTTTTLAPTTTTTTTFGPISINVSGSCLALGAQLTILGITGGSGGPYFHSLQQDGVYLPSSSEYNTYTNLNNIIYTVYADNNFGSAGSQSVDLSGCQPLIPTTTTTAGPTTTTTTTTAAPTTTTTSTTTTTTTTAGPVFVSFDYLIVAGGGGASRNGGGGGGAGGLRSGSATATLVSSSITQFAVVVGAGGAGSSGTQGGNGSTSSFYSTSSIGGGGGGAGLGGYETGLNGGSGGGSHRTALPGTGSLGQGFNGNSGSVGVGVLSNGGGGGGASQSGSGGDGGVGGSGSVWLNGITYAGGGAGGYGGSNRLPGGPGGGGAGGTGIELSQLGISGSVNTGGGAGGNGVNANINAPNGGSGVVIVRYPIGSVVALGGLITSQSGYTYHTFNSSSNFVIYT